MCPAFAHGIKPIHVWAGQSIQAAINTAHYGCEIIVEAGTYAEQLTIQTDGVALIGRNAILVPPATPVQNECSGLAGNETQAGICVLGAGVELAPFIVEHRKVLSVVKPVKYVSITGFQVRGFSGENIAVVGAEDTKVTANYLYDGEQYGFLTAGSKNTLIAYNTVIATSQILFIGICNDDAYGAQVLENHVTGYYVGLCIQTHGAVVRNNDVSGCCIDAFVDPGVVGAQVQQNHFSNINPSCDLANGGGGVFLDGSVNTDVRYNLIEGQSAGGLAAGVVLVDDPATGSVASGNVVVDNTLRDNDLDLYVNTTGTGNVIANNQCSTPKELCA